MGTRDARQLTRVRGRSRALTAQEFSIHYGSVEWMVERRFAELRAELGAAATMRDIKTLIMRCA